MAVAAMSLSKAVSDQGRRMKARPEEKTMTTKDQ